MYTRVKASELDVRKQVEKVMHYHLASVVGSVEHVTVTVDNVTDRLGARLRRCRVDVLLVGGEEITLVETQSDLMLAAARAMDRCVRTIRRRHGLNGYQRSA